MVVAIFVAGFVALVAYSTFNGQRFRAEVCMEYGGQSSCRTVKAKSKQAALRAGTENACADIASGVTDTMRCVEQQPKSVKWLK
ncbi:MAG TPA: hypothetical protein VLI55_10925 [Bryobacteraceae bacterium]|nr:hypothetical protein [Bryobacteraceae bacterium]